MLGPDDIFLHEDENGILVNPFTLGQLLGVMFGAAQELVETHGDHWDFVGFWMSFAPHPPSQFGAAFYSGLTNDVQGIGLPLDGFGFSFSDRLQGQVQMYFVNGWIPGNSGSAAFTRLVLGQEFEHRWAMFLNPITGNRSLQGFGDQCGRVSHWNFSVDCQGSCMECRNWVGSNPASLSGGSLGFIADIGGVFSYIALYLMGYVSPAEMDAGMVE